MQTETDRTADLYRVRDVPGALAVRQPVPMVLGGGEAGAATDVPDVREGAGNGAPVQDVRDVSGASEPGTTGPHRGHLDCPGPGAAAVLRSGAGGDVAARREVATAKDRHAHGGTDGRPRFGRRPVVPHYEVRRVAPRATPRGLDGSGRAVCGARIVRTDARRQCKTGQ